MLVTYCACADIIITTILLLLLLLLLLLILLILLPSLLLSFLTLPHAPSVTNSRHFCV